MSEVIDRTTERQMQQAYRGRVNLSDCDVEPLRRIQVVQAHACVIAIDRDTFVIEQISDNAEHFIGKPAAELLGQDLSVLWEADIIGLIRQGIRRDDFASVNPIRTYLKRGPDTYAYQLAVSPTDRHFVIEVEPAESNFQTAAFQQRLGRAVEAIQGLKDFGRMFAQAAYIVKSITGFDRVMIYRFDDAYNGEVIAESREEHLEPFLHLRYPASDIPKTSRDIYHDNQIRMIADTVAEPSEMVYADHVPADGVMDMTPVAARGMSPVHREYLRNIDVRATCSLAVIIDGKLWGLIAMHHYRGPRYLDYEMRSFLKFLGKVLSGHIALQSASEYRNRILEVNVVRSQLGEQISDSVDLGAALTNEGAYSVLDIVTGTQGAAVSVEGKLYTTGRTPDETHVERLAAWVASNHDDPLYFASSKLSDGYEQAHEFAEDACGVLLLWLEKDRREYIMWFREEIVRQVKWGGSPDKERVGTADGGYRLSPSRSFQRYTEIVRGSCEPWTDAQVDAALALRSHVKDVVMRRYQQVKRVNAELADAYREMETFSYTVSHDLRAPLRGISGYAEIILEDYGDQLDEEGREMLVSIRENTDRMNVFINELLEMSKVGVSELDVREVDLGQIARGAFAQLRPAYAERDVEFALAPDLPPVMADSRLMTVAIGNLLSNAIKYSYNQPSARVEFGYVPDHAGRRGPVFYVRDNGIGFDEAHASSLFEMFTRLNVDSRVEGNGVGLALVHRVIAKHQGEIWAESQTGKGATFYFSLGGR